MGDLSSRKLPPALGRLHEVSNPPPSRG
jgi:hypothetical protein